MKLLSTVQVAKLRGCSRETVCKKAKSLGVGRMVGRTLAFDEDEAVQIVKSILPVGRPKKTKPADIDGKPTIR